MNCIQMWWRTCNLVLFAYLFLERCEAKVDIRQTTSNKAFMSSLAEGDYEVVHPFQIRDKNDRIGIDTRNYFLKAAEHYQHVTLVVRSNVIGRLKLVLERNNYIFVNQTSFRKLDSNGEHGLTNRVENCYYQGTVAGDSSSFVALSSCNGLRGIIGFANGTSYGIWPLDGGDRGRRHPHILYKTTWKREARCGSAIGAAAAQMLRTRDTLPHRHRLRKRRDLSRQTKYVEVALVGDYEFMKEHGSIEDEAMTYMLEAVNVADLMLSRDLNIRLSVVYSEIWLDVQRIDLFEDLERTLTGVVDYSAGHLYNMGKDATLLFTGGSFAGSEVANAAFGSICTARSAMIVKGLDAYVSHWSGQALAQSVGHLLGLEHDTPSCQCDSENHCVMNGHIGEMGAPFAWQFSKCSVARMHGVWQNGHVKCLLNRPFQASQHRECGNGIVDGNEECDCGSREECTDPCCDPLTCTLRAHAQCAAHHKCCYRCELRKSGEVCRASTSPCDVAETCDGTSGDCPADGHLIDGTACGEDGQCWRGNCSDPQTQCQQIWGRDARVAEPSCFEQNMRGHEYANCGGESSSPEKAVRSCHLDDIRCGTLHCQAGATTPLQMALKAFTFHFPHNEQQIQCKSIADAGVGLVADGSSCGSGRVCVANSCVEMSSVSVPVTCPSNNHALQCSGHGDCTTTSICVCFAGWSGKACDMRTNGTVIRGKNNQNKQIVNIPSLAMGKSLETATLLGILLIVGVFLLLLLVCLLFCYRRRTVMEVPSSLDEKLNDSLPDQTQRSIKFGNMPSYREEKRKRKSNKLIYGALNRITEADERDSTSLKSRDSASITMNGSQMIFEPRPIQSSRSDVGGPTCSDRGHDHIYAESAIGIGYRNESPMRRMHVDGGGIGGGGYSNEGEAYGMRSFGGGSWRGSSVGMSPSDSGHNIPGMPMAPTPLRLNNIGQILRNLHADDMTTPTRIDLAHQPDRGSSTSSSSRLIPFSDPSPMQYPNASSYTRNLMEEEELSGVEADHELASNTESMRGALYEHDLVRAGSGTVSTGVTSASERDRSDDGNDGMLSISPSELTPMNPLLPRQTPPPNSNQPKTSSSFNFRQSPSLFSDTFKLDMSSSMHT